VTINGPGAANLAVNGNAASRVFENFASGVTISGFTITNGFATDADGGGGILNHGGLTLRGTSILSNNIGSCGASCLGSGGGINSNSDGTLTVTNCIISHNSAGGILNGSGGGMYLAGGGTATVTDSTISDNLGGGGGGGILSSLHMLTVTNSTISNNSSVVAFGGGIGVLGMTVVMNSTISHNTVNGVFNVGTITVTNSTISSEAPGGGGCLFNDPGGTVQMGDTILTDCRFCGGTIANAGTFTSLGYNLASDNGGGVLTGHGDQINTDPMLGPLQDNGGPTFTQALLPGSPAINAGVPIFTTPPPRYDQRGPGFARVVHGRIDIGSFEVQR
jgi:hypothetical protein